jgi:hypothetical protein
MRETFNPLFPNRVYFMVGICEDVLYVTVKVDRRE